MTVEPLPMPEDFDPKNGLRVNRTENGLFHEVRKGAGWAAELVANGAPQDLALAHKVLDIVLRCQERRASDPHHGNFTWMIEDDIVFDLNAVEFTLARLIPMLIRHGDRLSPEMQTRLREAIRLGLKEIARLDVHVRCTNITVLDILNTTLGGELLQEAAVVQRGHRKLVDWMAETDRQGTVYEYNSPTYAAVTLRSLKTLSDLTHDPDTRVRARMMAARLGLSAALHIHNGTGRWAGPHSRSYHPSVVGETEAEAGLIRQWIADGTLPAWIADALAERPAAFEVVETASIEQGMGLTTYHSPSFALGVSTREFSGQSDVLMAHYSRAGADRPGVLYTRYLTNDKWLGDFYHATDRTQSRNLIEEGQFYGVQHGARAIGLYTLPPWRGNLSSAKAALIWTERQRVDEIWVGSRPVASLPAEVEPGQVIVVASGDALMAVRPLTRTDLGRDAPIRLVERQGDLVLELYNYLGTAKPFWELEYPGAFFKGRVQCGVYVELAERTAFPDGLALAQTVASGVLKDVTDAPFTLDGHRPRLWTVEYVRDGLALGIEADLHTWTVTRRWTEAGNLGWPMLESPVARETRIGHITVGGATLTCGRGAAWLFASPATRRWVAGYHGEPAPLTLEVPGDRVQIPATSTGTVEWNSGKCIVDSA